MQFETIHQFFGGNGRLGRLLITFLLCAAGTLREPILYLSLFFKMHRHTYYDLLVRVRQTGDWEAWMEFFFTGVKETAEQAVSAARRILALLDTDRQKIEALGRPAATVLLVFLHAQKNPSSRFRRPQKVGFSFPTVNASVNQLQTLGVLREITGKQRRRLFVYEDYLKILNEGTEPLR